MPVVYRKHPQIAGRIVDRTAFVVTADDNVLHTLNDSGTVIWSLAAGDFTVIQAAEALTAEFEVSSEQALEDAAECLELFVKRGLLVSEER